MDQPLLSICCLGYNHAPFLEENLRVISKIDYASIEVVVVDDGSSDDSVPRLQKIAENYPLPIRVIAQENTGNIGKNLNTTLKQATGELIAFIALDDVFHPKTVRTEIEMMNQQPELAFVASQQAVTINDDGMVYSLLPPLPIAGKAYLSAQELLECEYADFGAFYVQGCIFRKSIIDEIGGFDEDMTGDDIILRTKLFRYMQNHPAWQAGFVEENNVFYRIHDNNVHKNSARQIRIVTEYLAKYWPNRPNPPLLTAWAKSALSDKSYSEAMEILNMNARAKLLLQEPAIQQALAAMQRQQSPLRQILKKAAACLIKKEKFANGARNLVFFGSIKYPYKKPRQTEALVHYTDYF